MRSGTEITRVEAVRSQFGTRLRSRRVEIESAVGARVYALADPTEVKDPEYLSGLRDSLRSAIEYSFDAIELGERECPSVPAVLRTQARAAARNDVPLETVLRRYFAGYALLSEFALEEAERVGGGANFSLREVFRGQAAVFDRLIAMVSSEYTQEAATRRVSSDERRGERICRLLAGEAVDSSDLAYELEAWHVAAIASGAGAAEAMKKLASDLDKRLLFLRRPEGITWAWLGSRHSPDAVELSERIRSFWPPEVPLVIGEPAVGSAGWRLSHRQAAAGFPLARASGGFLRYADVALLASTLQDDLLATSLHQLFLAPLEGDRDGGETLRETLRAYLAAGRNVSSAAAALGVSRHTVMNRLRASESRIGRYIDGCTAEIEAALQLDELDKTGQEAASPHPSMIFPRR